MKLCRSGAVLCQALVFRDAWDETNEWNPPMRFTRSLSPFSELMTYEMVRSRAPCSFFSGEKKWWRKYNHDKPIDSLVKYIRISEHLSRHEISLGRRANVCSHYMWCDLLYFSWGSLFIRPNHEIPLACNATITVKLRENKGRSISRKLPRKNWYTFEMSP